MGFVEGLQVYQSRSTTFASVTERWSAGFSRQAFEHRQQESFVSIVVKLVKSFGLTLPQIYQNYKTVEPKYKKI